MIKNIGGLVIREVDGDSLPMALLLEADPDEQHIRSYLSEGRCFVAQHGHTIIGACVLVPRSAEELELLNIAVLPERQGQGIGARLLAHLIAVAREEGARRVTLGTGAFGYQLAFYQRAGFRVVAVERDYFVRHYADALYENGIRHRDRLWLELQLDEPGR